MSVKVTIETPALSLGKSEHGTHMSDRWYLSSVICDLVAAYDAAVPPPGGCPSDSNLRDFLLTKLQKKE